MDKSYGSCVDKINVWPAYTFEKALSNVLLLYRTLAWSLVEYAIVFLKQSRHHKEVAPASTHWRTSNAITASNCLCSSTSFSVDTIAICIKLLKNHFRGSAIKSFKNWRIWYNYDHITVSNSNQNFPGNSTQLKHTHVHQKNDK